MILQALFVMAALVPSPGDKGQVPTPEEFSAPLRKLLTAVWPDNRTVTIVCHGHSVPAGYFKTPEVQSENAYPALLRSAIEHSYPHAVVNVVVTAIGGEDSESGAKRFEHDVLALHPDVVTIDYSLNDRHLGLERARAAWVSMVTSAQKAGVQVILMTPSWDLSAHPENLDDPLSQHAEQVRAMAKQYRTGLADSLSALQKLKLDGKDIEGYMSQVNHPNRAGHEVILQGLLPWFGIQKEKS